MRYFDPKAGAGRFLEADDFSCVVMADGRTDDVNGHTVVGVW